MGWIRTIEDHWHNVHHIIRMYVAYTEDLKAFAVFFDGVDGEFHIHETFDTIEAANQYLFDAFGEQLHFSPGPFVTCKTAFGKSLC